MLYLTHCCMYPKGPDGDAGKPGSTGLPGLPGADVRNHIKNRMDSLHNMLKLT